MTGPPMAVQVGPVLWDVVLVPDSDLERFRATDENLLGLADPRTATISLASDAAPDVMRETLLHEILHAVYFGTGSPLHRAHRGGAEAEEVAVSSLSPTLLDVLQRNPLVVHYLTGPDPF